MSKKNINKHNFITGTVVDDKGDNIENMTQLFDTMCYCKFDCCLNAVVLPDNKTGNVTYAVIENGVWVFYTDVDALKAAKTS